MCDRHFKDINPNMKTEQTTTSDKVSAVASNDRVIDDVKFTITLGSVEPKTFNKFEGGRMVTYSFSIHRDQHGIETHRTEPMRLSSLGWDNGEPFTKRDHDKLASL